MIKASCHCHIVHNASRHSLKLVSYDVESFVLKIYNAFSLSSKNVANLECLNLSNHQILRHLPIRWLPLPSCRSPIAQLAVAVYSEVYFAEASCDSQEFYWRPRASVLPQASLQISLNSHTKFTRSEKNH